MSGRRPLTESEVKALELRRSCIHEFAHAAVARHFGVFGSVEVFPNETRGPDDKFFAGQFTLYGPLSAEHGRIVGLAGTVAEYVDGDPHVDAESVAEYLFADDLSETDARLADGFDGDDVEETVALVKRLWSEIVQSAEFEVRCFEAVGDKAGQR
jgi:hypothetical protein